MGHGHRPKAGLMRRLFLAVILLAACLTQAMADDDQDAARHAREAGTAVPFEQILERARREHPGRLLGVEVERHGERLVYELRILAPGGHIEEWRYDAQDATPVAKGHVGHDHEEHH